MTLFEFCRHLWHQKSLTSIVWRCLRPKFSLSLLYRRVTDTQRDRHTTEHIYCVTIASRGKKSNDEYFPHIQLNKAQRECYDLTLHYLARTANLYILLALISFFFVFNDRSENNCPRICWTNFHNLFTKWQRSGCRWSIWTSFTDISGRCHGNQFCGKMTNSPHFHSGIPKRNGIATSVYALTA